MSRACSCGCVPLRSLSCLGQRRFPALTWLPEVVLEAKMRLTVKFGPTRALRRAF